MEENPGTGKPPSLVLPRSKRFTMFEYVVWTQIAELAICLVAL